MIHNILIDTSTRFGSSSTDRAEFAVLCTLSEASLLFLRDYAQAEWLSTVEKNYRVGPEPYWRHLQYKAVTSGGRDLHSSPALPSPSTRVFQITIPMICTRNSGGPDYEPEDLQQARRLESETIDRFFKQLRTSAKTAHSVVRNRLLMSKQEFLSKQTVSIEIKPPGYDWHAVVYLCDCYSQRMPLYLVYVKCKRFWPPRFEFLSIEKERIGKLVLETDYVFTKSSTHSLTDFLVPTYLTSPPKL